MVKLIKYAFAAVLTFGALLLGSCHGQQDDIIPDQNDPTNVPEGVLRIFADKIQIAADGSDMVTFTVMFGSEDVSTARTLQLVRTSEGGEKLMDYGVNTFSTTIPATYTFKAEFYRAGRYYSDNEVQVVAVSSAAGGDTQQWEQRVLGLQFTSTGCVNCPVLSTSLKAVQEEMPGKLSVVSFHQNFNNVDVMSHPMTSSYYKQIKRQGLPQFNANLIIDDDYITVSEKSVIEEIVERTWQEYPATCGVAMESSLYVGGDMKVEVSVRVTSNTPSAYRYQIFLVEDKIMDFQEGVSGMYEHNNVLRATSSEKVYGDNLNEGIALQVGVEATAERTITIPAGCNLENMRIVVAAFVSYDGGNSYIVNNCAECKLGESVDYAIVSE